MPAPSAFHFFRLGQAVDPSAYPDVSAYFDDLVAVYRAELKELAQAGCRYVQLDEVPVAMLCDPDVCRQAAAQGGDPTALLDTYLGLLQRIVADRPAGMTFGMHLCRGNFRGRWMAAGGYEPVAEKLFNATPVDVFFLEYDSERAGDFQPLRLVPKGKRVVLGLVSSKTAQLEDQDSLLRRIEDGLARPPPRPARPVHPMRLCQRGGRQCAERGRAMGQARADRRNRRARLGQPVGCRRPGIWHTRPLRAACKAKETTALGVAAATALRSRQPLDKGRSPGRVIALPSIVAVGPGEGSSMQAGRLRDIRGYWPTALIARAG